MEKVIELLIILLSLAYIGLPLFRKQAYDAIPGQASENEKLHRLLTLKENAYQTIKDIQFDYKTGKISEEDYSELLSRYEGEAMDILKEIDNFQKSRKKNSTNKNKKTKT